MMVMMIDNEGDDGDTEKKMGKKIKNENDRPRQMLRKKKISGSINPTDYIILCRKICRLKITYRWIPICHNSKTLIFKNTAKIQLWNCISSIVFY